MTATDRALATEAELRSRLGVPLDAPQVMVVAESTHWDPDWLLTSKEYFRFGVRRTLDKAVHALLAEPRRVYSLECAFYPAIYVTRRPQQQAVFRELVNAGRLRFTGSGVTTPDTLIPEDELLLRDLLLGQEWLRANGMTQEPRVLYLPDSFGHSPGLPALLDAAGVHYAGVCRIDGMFIAGAEWESASHFPRPGTSAAFLTAERTADFIWRAPDGSEVLTHWHAHGYGHGDMIASAGLSRWMGLPTAWPSRGESAVARRVERYAEQLSRLARTPYLLLSIGFDFVDPVPGLVGLIDRWNEGHYARTGIWLVSGALDDYLDLVSHHRDRLPVLDFDPNPYWMGFYSSRLGLKQACKQLGRSLVAADDAAARDVLSSPERPPRAEEMEHRQGAWWIAATSNHHDFVTGTSPDRVTNGEQWPWLRHARALVAPENEPTDGNGGGAGEGAATCVKEGGRVTITTPHLTAVFDEAVGGALVSLTDSEGRDLITAPALVLVAYAESGGLWRMGHELRGGSWRVHERSTSSRASITVDERGPSATVVIRGRLDGQRTQLEVHLDAQSPTLRVDSAITASDRRTITLAVPTGVATDHLLMHQPGAVVRRPLTRWFDPTFWPLHSWAVAIGPGGRGPDSTSFGVAAAVPTALHARHDGRVEVVVARNATKERIYGVLPEVGQPARGHERGVQHQRLSLGWHAIPAGGGPAELVRFGRALTTALDALGLGRASPWAVGVDDPDVEVIAVKPADRGDGVIVRLRSWHHAVAATDGRPLEACDVSLRLAQDGTDARLPRIAAAWRTDSRERDLGELTVVADAAGHPSVVVPITRHLTTVRIIPRLP